MKKRTEIFNTIRMAFCGMNLNRNEVKEALKELPQSQQEMFITKLVEHGMIKRVKLGVYQFTETPVHYSVLEEMYKDINRTQKVYNDRAKCKKHNQTQKSDIDKAIDLLLATGEYEIYKIEKIVNIKKIQLSL